LITRLDGTLAPMLAEAAQDAGADVVGWDRRAAPKRLECSFMTARPRR